MLFQKWWYLRTILKYGSPLISLAERKRIRRLGNDPAEHPVIFIIGPPRSGSTIIYQLITSMLDVAFIDNLSNLARNNPFTGMQLSRYFFADRPHRNYASSYGQTTEGGLHAPAEAMFPYLWFPTDRHFTGSTDLNPRQINAFRTTMNSLVNAADKTLVIKNLSFSMRLQVLKEALPQARYIVVRRKPVFTAQSILLAMKKNKVQPGKLWSIRPRHYEKIEGLEPAEMVVRQINLIEKQIAADLEDLDKDKILYIDYETLDRDMEKVLQEVIRLSGGKTRIREGVKYPDIHVRNELILPDEQVRMLEEQIAEQEWELHNK